MDPLIVSTRRGRSSRINKVRRFQSAEAYRHLQEKAPAEFAYDKSSPSAALQHVGWVLGKAYLSGFYSGDKLRQYKMIANQRFIESKLRSYSYLYGNPLKYDQDRVFHEEQKKLQALRLKWKNRTIAKRSRLEDSYYYAFDECQGSQDLHGL